jgi:hypothetical protein
MVVHDFTTPAPAQIIDGAAGRYRCGDVRKRPFPDTCAAFETIRGAAGRSLFETLVRNRDRAVCLRTRFGRFTLAGYASDVKTTPA